MADIIIELVSNSGDQHKSFHVIVVILGAIFFGTFYEYVNVCHIFDLELN